MTGLLLRSLGISLLLTLCLELGVALLWGKRGRALLLTALANVLTNPLVVLLSLLWQLYSLPAYGAAMAAGELGALIAEGIIYKKSREFSRPFLFSLCANALSFGLGLLLHHLL